MCYRAWKYTVFEASPCILQPGNFTGWSSEGVNLPPRHSSESAHKGVNSRSKYVTQVQQQRPESPAVTLTWHASQIWIRTRPRALVQWATRVFVVVLVLRVSSAHYLPCVLIPPNHLNICISSLSLAGNWGHFTWLRHSIPDRAALPISTSLCRNFQCPNNGLAVSA